jgi:hypothetical protein
VIPPKASSEFVYYMEDVLSVYTRPLAIRSFVSTKPANNSSSKHKFPCPPTLRGQPKRYDYEYKRNGVCNLFMFCEPLAGWRHVAVTERRTKRDYTKQMKYLVDVRYPDVEWITIIHDPSALYETFAPQEAKRILDKLEIHYTPKHGSW